MQSGSSSTPLKRGLPDSSSGPIANSDASVAGRTPRLSSAGITGSSPVDISSQYPCGGTADTVSLDLTALCVRVQLLPGVPIQRVSSVAEREAHNLDVTRAIRVPATISPGRWTRS